MKRFRKGVFIFISLFLMGCVSHPLSQGRDFQLQAISFSMLPNWNADDFLQALPAIKRSCEKPTKLWESFCEDLMEENFETGDSVRLFLEKNLIPYQVTSNGKSTGLFTGYYEAELSGSRQRTSSKQIPVYGVPATQSDKECTRQDIHRNPNFPAPIIAYANDAVELFILQVQGSGRMKTPTGEIRLVYAGNNGHPFKGIGRIMQEHGLLQAGKSSMPDMKKWLQANPQKALELMLQNPRYIYFRETVGETPFGSTGVVLTPKRSVAVDNDYIPPHTLLWLDTTDGDGDSLTQLVVAQDVGSGVKGPIRADFFWGHGGNSFEKAGRMKSSGTYYLLLPR